MRLTKNLLAPKTLLLLALLYSLIITIAFLVPGRAVPATKLPIDKVVHVGIHAGLLFVWMLYFFKKYKNSIHAKTLFLVAAGCFLYGIIIEVLQGAYIALRYSDNMDLAANSLGTLLGAVVFYKAKHYFENQK